MGSSNDDQQHAIERDRRLSALLAQALDLPTAQRTALLDRVREQDATLGAELADLLAADACSQPLLDAPLLAAATLPASGDHVGPYRLVRSLGRGGMGEVWLAERSNGGFTQTVALKLIRPGFDSRAVRERFLRERQILADLTHPHIARLLDGGTGSGGQPWFALEYVEGEPLTALAARLTLSARLRLFVQVCRAVHYAHSHLVIHRDLKPANILVTADGAPKLLDFGIATLLSDPAGRAGDTALTALSGRAATPEYAAPEQLAGGAVTTACDVYALGLVLYELLTGMRCDRGSAITPAPSAAAGNAVLRRALRGDLDTIVQRALAPEPPRRYASAEALAEDVERHLGGLPVTARRDSVGYRAGKFLRRHWLVASAAAAVVLALAAGLGAALWQAGVARAESQRAETVSAFLTDLFQSNDPDRAQGENPSARELLDRGALRAQDSLGANPDLGIALSGVIGTLYGELGAYDAAQPLLDRRIDAARQRYGENDPRTLRALLDRAHLDVLRYRFDAARPQIEHALAALERAQPGGADHADALGLRARIEMEKGEYPAALRDYRAAEAIRRGVFGAADRRTAETALGIADVEQRLGRYAAAEATMRAAIVELDADPATPLSLRSQARFRLAAIEKDAGRPREAELLLREMLPLLRNAWGADHERVADVLHDLGNTLRMQGKDADAVELQQQALAIYRRGYGASIATATALHDLGATLVALDRTREAEPLLVEAENMYRDKLGDAHAYVAMTRVSRARAARHAGDLARARELFADALARYERTLPAGNPVIETARDGLAEALLESGRAADAEPLERAVLANWRKQLGADDQRTAQAEVVLARARIALGDPAEARVLLGHAAPILAAKLGAQHPQSALASALLASFSAPLPN